MIGFWTFRRVVDDLGENADVVSSTREARGECRVVVNLAVMCELRVILSIRYEYPGVNLFSSLFTFFFLVKLIVKL